MSSQNYFSAKLPDGLVLSRSSLHDYTHAWALYLNGKIIRSGFASSQKKAERAGSAARSLWACDDLISKSKRAKTPRQARYYADLIKQNGGEEAYTKARNESLSVLHYFVVEAVKQ